MKKKVKYSNEPLGKVNIVKDFLPPPEALVLQEEKVKITISLSKDSVEFFKKEAKKNGTSYQRMIRKAIDLYVARFQQSP